MLIIQARAHLLIFLNSVVIAGSFLVSENLVNVANSLSLTLLRFIGASLLLLPFVIMSKKRFKAIPSTLPRSLVISFFYSLFFIGFFESLKTTTSLSTGAIYTLMPLTTGILSLLIFKISLDRRRLLLYSLGVVATCWVIFKGDIDLILALSLNKGDLIFFGSMFMMCGFTISMKMLYRNDDLLVLVFCNLLGGAIWMFLAKLVLAYPLNWHEVQGSAMWYMCYLIVPATLLTVYLFQRTTIVLGPNNVNAYVYLYPALIAILAYIIDGIQMPARIAPAILISAVVTFSLLRRKQENA